MSRKNKLDNQDYAIMEILQIDSSLTNKELAERIGLSPPATLVRVKHLKEKGYLLKTSYQLNWSKLGFNSHIHIYCYVHTNKKQDFLDFIDSFPQIISSYELRESDEFTVYHKITPFILFGVFRTQTEYHENWYKVFTSKEFVESYRGVRVHEKRNSVLPIPLHG